MLQPGMIVNVWNHTFSGTRVLEGRAMLLERLGGLIGDAERWRVRFDGDEETYDRTVRPQDLHE